jgi:hypothetical protein
MLTETRGANEYQRISGENKEALTFTGNYILQLRYWVMGSIETTNDLS